MHHKKKKESELADKAEEYLAGWKRSQADYQNLQKEYSQRMAGLAEQAAAEVIVKFLPVIDNFELALTHMPEAVKHSEWAKGLFQVQKERDELLDTLGIKRVKTSGAMFDPNVHEAVGYEPSESVSEGHVVREVQAGYRREGGLIRPARVIVSKGPKK